MVFFADSPAEHAVLQRSSEALESDQLATTVAYALSLSFRLTWQWKITIFNSFHLFFNGLKHVKTHLRGKIVQFSSPEDTHLHSLRFPLFAEAQVTFCGHLSCFYWSTVSAVLLPPDSPHSRNIMRNTAPGKACEDFYKWSQLLDYYSQVVSKMEAQASTHVRGAAGSGGDEIWIIEFLPGKSQLLVACPMRTAVEPQNPAELDVAPRCSKL